MTEIYVFKRIERIRNTDFMERQLFIRNKYDGRKCTELAVKKHSS